MHVNDTPSISVIIPTYNRAETVKRAVESVLSQTYRNFELIVVDDGSTDNTGKTLNSYAPHLRYLHQPNRGVSAARNAGAREAAGEYVAFLDSDDEWKPEKLEKHIKYMLANNFSVSQADEIWIRNGKRLNKGKRHQKFEGDIFLPSLSLCLVTPSAVMMKKELFRDYGGFDENLPACEDYDLWLRMALNEKFGYLKEDLVVKYGGHEDQLSAMPVLDKFRIISLYNLLESGSLPEGEKKDAVKDKLLEKAEIFLIGARKRDKTKEIAWMESILSAL